MILLSKKKLSLALLIGVAWAQLAVGSEMECNRENLDKQMADNAQLINEYIENSEDELEASTEIRTLTEAYGNSDRYIDTSDEAGELMADASQQPTQLMCDQMEEVHDIFESYIHGQKSIADIKREFSANP